MRAKPDGLRPEAGRLERRSALRGAFNAGHDRRGLGAEFEPPHQGRKGMSKFGQRCRHVQLIITIAPSTVIMASAFSLTIIPWCCA